MNNCMVQTQNSNDSFYVKVQNNGGYFTEFYLTYEYNGVEYNLDSGDFSLGFSRTLNFPKNCGYVYLKIEIHIFGGVRIAYEDYLSTTSSSCLLLYGTIFNPTCTFVPCNSVGGPGPQEPPCTPCCCCCCNCPSTCNNSTCSNVYDYPNYYNGCQ